MPNDLTILSASAGSGKTYTLTGLLAGLLDQGVRPDGVVATTFTRKAASELSARVRSRLIAAGKADAAQCIQDGYIGTVNAVCGAILGDYALEAGLSPNLDVLPDGEDSAVFRAAVSEVLRLNTPPLTPVLRSLGLFDLRESWDKPVKRIIDAARANRIDRAELLACAEKSWESFRQLLPEPLSLQDGRRLDDELRRAVDEALRDLPAPGDGTKATEGVRDRLRIIRNNMRNGAPGCWGDWISLAKFAPGKQSRDIVQPITELAEQVLGHPRLHHDVETYIRKMFECASDAMGRYQQYKKDLGLIDFTDQEALTLSLLENDDIGQRLRERLDLLMVDEFQDTSPIQLALFLRLSQVAGKSVWVGDQKQSIYAFRGTDPGLMDAVVENVDRVEVLGESWRSQPDLVRFANAFFGAAMRPHGIPAAQVELVPKVVELETDDPHLMCWRLQANNKTVEAACLASGIVDLLSSAGRHAVLDKATGGARPLRPGDIAVLCLKNHECELVAEALNDRGIRAAVPRPGLMAQPETQLALAAFRYLADESDLLAVAEMARLLAGEEGPDWWLPLVRPGDLEAVKERIPAIHRLDAARSNLVQLTAVETLDLAVSLVDARPVAKSWPHPGNRLANLDALRGYALAYEDACGASRSPATSAGLLAHFSRLAADKEDKQAEGGGSDAVQVLTYHRSKGLEWPLVVLTGMDSVDNPRIFGLNVCSDSETFDMDNPLAGRWLRFWPWPFGAGRRIPALEEALEGTAAQRRAEAMERRERLRLLYVGMTRARDHLVLAARIPGKTDGTTSWLDACVDETGEKVFVFPLEPGVQTIRVGADHQARIDVGSFAPESEGAVPPPGVPRTPALPVEPAGREPARFALGGYPSNGTVRTEAVRIGPPYPIGKREDPARLGSAVHAFLGAVPGGLDRAVRETRAQAVLADWELSEVDAATLCEMQDRLAAFIGERFGDPGVRTEWPVHLRRGPASGAGWVDMLLGLPEADVIIDHKTATGSADRLEAKAASYAGQLSAYAEAMSKASGRPVRETWIHFPLAGLMVNVTVSDE
ncbi:UvrD/REP helicase [Pseudodesulfovibrio mercurii]|uniref:DNA 3'-5' helicase n=1 Tax=Pseudodesulfovibrio mercurii TaxID=641491 RepID=F0JE39_9BACT|nr:UvrD-helicase domain-containing protein [Pseudodesulfovibrio mercurii]EGB14648.1 UvrD/REP helicase [Pseudodesulfovibrio mercurii]